MESHLPRSDRFCRQLPITSSRSTPCSLETQAVTGQVVAGLLGECTTCSRTLLSFRKEVLDAVALLGHTSCLSLSPISGTSPSKEGLSGRGGGPMVQDPSLCSALNCSLSSGSGSDIMTLSVTLVKLSKFQGRFEIVSHALHHV